MDNLELPSVERGTHQINYNIPRICNITNADFDFVMQVDRNKLSLVELYGKLPVCFHVPFFCSFIWCVGIHDIIVS